MMLKMIPAGEIRRRIFTLGRETNTVRCRSIVTRHLLRNKNRMLHMCITSEASIELDTAPLADSSLIID